MDCVVTPFLAMTEGLYKAQRLYLKPTSRHRERSDPIHSTINEAGLHRHIVPRNDGGGVGSVIGAFRRTPL